MWVTFFFFPTTPHPSTPPVVYQASYLPADVSQTACQLFTAPWLLATLRHTAPHCHFEAANNAVRAESPSDAVSSIPPHPPIPSPARFTAVASICCGVWRKRNASLLCSSSTCSLHSLGRALAAPVKQHYPPVMVLNEQPHSGCSGPSGPGMIRLSPQCGVWTVPCC